MPVVQSSDTSSFIQKSADKHFIGEKLELRGKDSIIIRERTVHDTVYITKEVYRDANTHNSSLIVRNSIDTVVVTEYRDRVVEHPPERYIPPFYKRCTIALWAIGILAIGYGLLRWRLRRRW